VEQRHAKENCLNIRSGLALFSDQPCVEGHILEPSFRNLAHADPFNLMDHTPDAFQVVDTERGQGRPRFKVFKGAHGIPQAREDLNALLARLDL
jgi:hypothetical protein